MHNVIHLIYFIGNEREMILALRRASTKRANARPIWDTPTLNKVQKNTSLTEEHELPRLNPIRTVDNQISINSTIPEESSSPPIYINLTYENYSPQSSETSDSSTYLMGTRVWIFVINMTRIF